jgi:aminopeptidase YwaD
MANHTFNPLEYNELLNSIDQKQLERHIRALTQWERLSGEKEAEKAAEYIVEELKKHDVQNECYQFNGFFSDPINGQVTVISTKNFNIQAKARSYSLHCPEGIKGDVVYDLYSDKQFKGKDPIDRYTNLKGKIVVSWNFYEDYVKKIESAGAIGLIHIWPSPEKVIHEETVGTVWGTPTIENRDQLTKIPVVGINYDDGIQLLKVIQNEDIKVVLKR